MNINPASISISTSISDHLMDEIKSDDINNTIQDYISDHKIRIAQVLLDSNNAQSVGNDLRWDVVNYNIISSGNVCVANSIKNIVGIQTNGFRMSHTSYGLYPIFTMLIRELAAQSTIAHQNRRFHFMYQMSSITNFKPYDSTMSYREFLPIMNTYLFNRPVVELSSITISLANPLDVIRIPRKTITISSENFSSAVSSVITIGDHQYKSGDLIYITGFNTIDPIGDVLLINAINSTSGITSTYVSPTQISIPVNLVGKTPTSSTVTIVNNNMRVVFPINLLYKI